MAAKWRRLPGHGPGTLGGPNGQATALNNNGQVVGFADVDAQGQIIHAFLWENGQMVDLDPGNALNSNAFAVNEAGDIVGRRQVASGGALQFYGVPGSQLLSDPEALPRTGFNNPFNPALQRSSKGEDDAIFIDGGTGQITNLNEATTGDLGLTVALEITFDEAILALGLNIDYVLEPTQFLTIKKEVSADTVTVGASVTITITVQNLGNAPAINVTVSDDPFFGNAEVDPGSVKLPCELNNDVSFVECNYAKLSPGEEKVITFVAKMTKARRAPNVVRAFNTKQLVDDKVVVLVEPDSSSLMLSLQPITVLAEARASGIAKATPNAAVSLDVYVDSVRVADDFIPLTAARIPVTFKRTAPVIDLVDAADPDNSNPRASFTVDFLTEENGELTYSRSNIFIVAQAANDSLALLVKQNARREASDPANVELLIANTVAQAGELDFRVVGGGIDQTLAQIDFGEFSDYTGGAPGSYDIEVLQSSDGVSLGTFRFALDAFQGQTVTLVAGQEDSSNGGNTFASAQQTAVTMVGFDSTGALIEVTNITSVASGEPLPQTFALQQNYPNPFNPETTIRYDLPAQTQVRLTIFDVLGRTVRTLVEQKQPAGAHSVVWNGLDDRGQQLASGLYVYRLEAGDFRKSAKMLLLK